MTTARALQYVGLVIVMLLCIGGLAALWWRLVDALLWYCGNLEERLEHRAWMRKRWRQ